MHGVDVFSVPRETQDQKDAYVKGVTLFTSALDQWLPCYSSVLGVGGGGDGDINGGQRLSSSEFACFFLELLRRSRELTGGVAIGQSLLTSILLAFFFSVILA